MAPAGAYDAWLMAWTKFNHRRVLRYTGLFTYFCVGVPLLQGTWSLTQVNSTKWGDPIITGWLISYACFGVAYLFLTSARNMHAGGLFVSPGKLIGLTVLTAAAVAVGW